MSSVQCRHPMVSDPLDQPLSRIVRIEGPELGLDRIRSLELVLIVCLVQVSCQSDDGMRIYQPWCHDPRGHRPVPIGYPDLARRPDPLDLSISPAHDHTIADPCTRHRIDGLTPSRVPCLEWSGSGPASRPGCGPRGRMVSVAPS